MEISIAKNVLVAAVSQVINAVSRRDHHPILSTILLDADEHGLTITATDLDKDVISHIHADEVRIIKAGSVCIMGHTLDSFVKRLRQGDVSITSDGSTAKVVSGNASIDLPAMSASDFPHLSVPEMDHAGMITAESLSWAIAQVSHAMSTEETRFYLNGIHMHVDEDRLIFVTTDGHRLAKVSIELPDGLSSMPPIILPRGAVGILQRLLSGVSGSDEISFSVDSGGIRARFDICGAVVVTKLVDATYPDYNRVIPKDANEVAVLNKEDLMRSIKIVGTARADKGGAVKLDFSENNACTLSTHDVDGRQCIDAIKADVVHENSYSTGYNAGYMGDIISASEGDEISISFADPKSPAIWKGSDGDSVFVIMPMRV
jgi:DNA polymerase III subunit beta